MQTQNVSTLKIHKLTQAQYDREAAAGNIDENALYLTPDEEIDTSAFMSSTNPVGAGAFSMNRLVDSMVGEYSFTEGENTVASGVCSHAAGYYTTADNYQYVVGKYNAARTTPTLDGQDESNEDGIFIVGNGIDSDDESRSNAFRVSSGGRCFCDRFLTTSAADFAELFEWSDGNTEDEDRRGLFVALDGEQIKLANSDDDYIGIISGTPAFVGNAASEEWHDKYVTDVFGARLTQKVEIPDKVDEETGEVLVPAHTVTRYIINPDYDTSKPYIMRENRQEWGAVGLCGQVVAVDDGTCFVGGYCKPSYDGIATAADNGYRVMKRIDDTHIKVLVK